jgi:hypothetical protein
VGQKYLLPCSCGQMQVIDRTDAGQTIRCGCGKPLEVPTLTQIALLEPVAGPARGAGRASSRWGLRQQLLTLGTLMILGGALMAGLVASYFSLFVPKRVPVETLPPLGALVLWDSLQLGISGDPADTTAQLLLMIDRHYKRSMVIAAAVGAVGALVFVVGLMVPRQSAAEPFSPESGAT